MAKFGCVLFLSLLWTSSSGVWFGGEEEEEELVGPLTGETEQLRSDNFTFRRSHFTCPVAPTEDGKECVNRHVNGRCPKGSQCFLREDLVRHVEYGICCCDNHTTPVSYAIHEKWSCRVHEGPNPSGARPFCDIFCCDRNGTAGTKCTWLEHKWGWPFAIPGSFDRHCCTGFDGASCQTRCDFAWLCCVSSVITWAVAATTIHCYRKILWDRHFWISAGVLCAHAFASWEAAQVAGHARTDSGLWVALTSAPVLLQYVVLRICQLCRRRRAVGGGRQPARVAVLLTIENYNSRAYAPVPDDAKDALANKLSGAGWHVRPYSTGGQADFESIRDFVQGQIEGTTGSEVLLYVSCHSFIVGDVPVILRSDAGKYTGMCRSKSLYTMIREMNQVASTNAKFIVFFNGCLVRPTCNLWWRLTFSACRSRGGLPQLRMGQTRVSICSACAPGEEAFVENSLSKALVEALEEGQGCHPIFESLQRKLAAGRPAQTLFMTGTESQIILDRYEQAD